jgi:outer membrane protein assembly factor BamB
MVGAAAGKPLGKVDIESYVASSPAFVDGCVYIGQFAGDFMCVDVGTRDRVWTYTPEDASAAFFSSAAVGDEVVVVGGRDNRVHCVDRYTGEPRWTAATKDEADASPVIAGDRVVTASNDGRVRILSLRDGKQVAVYEIGAGVAGSPAVAGRVVVVGADDGRVYAFDTSGED